MFTGIVQGKAQLTRAEHLPGLHRLRFRFPPASLAHVTIGASIAINGVCLTVVWQENEEAQFDVMQESLTKTGLGQLKTGDTVNFERAARIGDEIGGHLLSGHIHTQAEVAAIEQPENNFTLTLALTPDWMRYVFAKGFIAINGASLTIGEVTDNRFKVHLIPETLRATTFAALRPGDQVNIEVDSQTQVIVDTLARMGLKPANKLANNEPANSA